MQISKSPVPYSSAFGDVVFVLTATPNEIVTIDIYDNAMTTVIGQKRFTGASSYDMNVAGYVRRQLNVAPLTPTQTCFMQPADRNAFVKIKCGNLSRTTIVTAGMEKPLLFKKLSRAPQTVEITPSQRYEYTVLQDDAGLSANCIFTGGALTKTLTLPVCTVVSNFASLCINMPDIAQRLRTEVGGTLSDYDTMTLAISNDYGHPDLVQTFSIAPERPDDVRLCWWNYYGQIDYYTMRRVGEHFITDKKRVYTAQGYKTIGSMADLSIDMVSDYCDRQTTEWLREIAAAPAVWIDTGKGMIPIEITTENITTDMHKLSRIELTAKGRTKQKFQNL